MSAITKDRLQMGPFILPLQRWQSDILDLFITEAVKAGETVLRIETKPFKQEPGTLTLVVPLAKPTTTTAPAAVEGR